MHVHKITQVHFNNACQERKARTTRKEWLQMFAPRVTNMLGALLHCRGARELRRRRIADLTVISGALACRALKIDQDVLH